MAHIPFIMFPPTTQVCNFQITEEWDQPFTTRISLISSEPFTEMIFNGQPQAFLIIEDSIQNYSQYDGIQREIILLRIAKLRKTMYENN